MTTSKKETKEAAIIAKASPALNVGGPHWKKPGKYTLRINSKLWPHLKKAETGVTHKHFTCSKLLSIFGKLSFHTYNMCMCLSYLMSCCYVAVSSHFQSHHFYNFRLNNWSLIEKTCLHSILPWSGCNKSSTISAAIILCTFWLVVIHSAWS